MANAKVWVVISEGQIGETFEAFSSFEKAKDRLSEIGDASKEAFTAYCMELEIDGAKKSNGAVDYTLYSIQSGANG